jgi:hypothetical protein
VICKCHSPCHTVTQAAHDSDAAAGFDNELRARSGQELISWAIHLVARVVRVRAGVTNSSVNGTKCCKSVNDTKCCKGDALRGANTTAMHDPASKMQRSRCYKSYMPTGMKAITPAWY